MNENDYQNVNLSRCTVITTSIRVWYCESEAANRTVYVPAELRAGCQEKSPLEKLAPAGRFDVVMETGCPKGSVARTAKESLSSSETVLFATGSNTGG